jgi:ribonuclease HI
LLHPDFVEVGSSGRLWGRQDIIDETAGHPSDEVVAFDLNARFLADDVVPVTYFTTHAEKNVHRCSVWTRDLSGWTVLYHQGTPALDQWRVPISPPGRPWGTSESPVRSRALRAASAAG